MNDRFAVFTSRASAWQFLRYMGVGGVGTLAHYCCLVFLVQQVRLEVVIASTFGALVGAGLNYALNYFFTFGSRRAHAITLPRFLIVAAGGLVINGAIVALLIATTNLHYIVVQVIATSTVLVMGFVANRRWTF